jgi:hypothetical protein
MSTVPSSDPGAGADDGGRRRYVRLTFDSWNVPDGVTWVPGPPGIASDVVMGDRSRPFLRGRTVAGIHEAIDSIEREGRLYADSGVDLVAVMDGQVFIAEAKAYASEPRHGHYPYTPVPRQGRTGRLLVWFSSFSVCGLTDLAALIAGRKRPALRAEWRAVLAGESGHDPAAWPEFKKAVGFVRAAVRCRVADAAEAAWGPLDAVLRSRKLSNLLVFGLPTMAAMFILRREGALGVLTSAESIIAIGGALYALVRLGRWWRDIVPPKPKARREAKE